MKSTFIKAEIITLLRKQQGERSLSEYAKIIGVSKQYLCDLYQGRREPGPKVLAFLRLEPVYRFIKAA